eukprot:TRINITY_DN66752_c0_g1_i1.p1 TRINITY_DN66752_c0_g1~~TRINITY_DN66752_c0_g1_i1.p1  ORF type:complete len:281 (+),score=34.09 TRINITY_DN66752_c0_g1_i1:33-845(+)
MASTCTADERFELVVRNTFLEVLERSPDDGSIEPLPRSQSWSGASESSSARDSSRETVKLEKLELGPSQQSNGRGAPNDEAPDVADHIVYSDVSGPYSESSGEKSRKAGGPTPGGGEQSAATPATISEDPEAGPVQRHLTTEHGWSAGAAGHFEGRCKLCVFLTKGGCTNGVDCPFCHLDHGPAAKASRPSKAKREQWKERIAQIEVTFAHDPKGKQGALKKMCKGNDYVRKLLSPIDDATGVSSSTSGYPRIVPPGAINPGAGDSKLSL